MNTHTLFLAVGWIVVASFAATSALTLFALAGKIDMPGKYLCILLGKVVIESSGAALFLFHQGVREAEPYDISGLWGYSWNDSTNEVGGYCTIARKEEGGDIMWQMNGVRRWIKIGTNNAHNLSTPADWGSDWAHVINRDKLKFENSLHLPSGEIVQGLGDITISVTGDTATRMAGFYSQLAPLGKSAGPLTFIKIKTTNEADAPTDQ